MFLFFTFGIFTSTYAACTPEELAAGTCTTGIVTLDNPLGDIKSPQALVGQVINSIFGIVGSLALVMFIYGGFLWLTSAGSAEQVKKGKDIFIWAVIGLVVIFSAYSLVRFVIQGVGA
jgi:amino acid transporter